MTANNLSRADGRDPTAIRNAIMRLNRVWRRVSFLGARVLNEQDAISDASVSHSTADFAGVNSALDAMGATVNEILVALREYHVIEE